MSHPIAAAHVDVARGQRAPGRADEIHLRPLGPSDRAAIRALLEGLSPRSRYLRFATPLPDVPATLVDRLARCDGERQVAWGAEVGGELIGMARLVRHAGDPGAAEFALTVADAHQRRGVGRRLLRHLARAAPRLGITRLSYYVLAENRGMLRLLSEAGHAVRYSGGAAEGWVAPEAFMDDRGRARPAA